MSNPSILALMLAICCSIASADNQRRDSLRPVNLVERNGKCVVIAWKPSPWIQGRPVKQAIPLPKLEGVFASAIERMEANPRFAEDLQKYPDLLERQRQLDAADPGFFARFGGVPVTPLVQMFDRWLGGTAFSRDYYEIADTETPIKSALQILTLPAYIETSFSEMPLPYRQPDADFTKPMLFFIDGKYYSVFGDCQVAKHVAIEGFPDNLAALRYAGNPLYARSETLPPALQSVGVDRGGVVWLADIEGHVAFFDTKTREFARRCAQIDGAARLLIPRANLTQSVFAFSDARQSFEEFGVEPGEKIAIPANRRTLAAGTIQVLYSGLDRLVSLTADKAVWQAEGEERTVALPIKQGEKVWEALYLPATDEVCLLVGLFPKPLSEIHELARLDECRKSWDSMRVIRSVSVAPADP